MSVDEDITRAYTLPAEFYRDRRTFDRLRERLFARSWQLLLEPPPAAAGDCVPYTFLPGCVDEPLLLTRDSAGTLHALSNVCTHRGNLVCSTPVVGLSSLRCRYHGRRFGLDGRFQSMPEFAGVVDFPAPADDLARAQLGRLGPLVFSAIEPAFACDDWLAGVHARLPELPWQRFVFDPAGSREYTVAANWALYCDNYLEGFHIPFVHPALARTVDFERYRSELYPWSNVQIAEATRTEDAFDGSPVAAYYFFLFPNTMLNFYPWGLSVNVVVPLAVDLTRILYRAWVLDESRRAGGPGGALDQVEHEDDAIVEQVQRGVQARLYRRGRYSPAREAGVHHFHRLLTRVLVEHE